MEVGIRGVSRNALYKCTILTYLLTTNHNMLCISDNCDC